MKRLVTGKIYRTDNKPWQKASVVFKRAKSNYNFFAQYPADIVVVKTDSLGNIYSSDSDSGVFLWANESGELNTVYSCYLPGCEPFEFSLPFNNGSKIDLSILRFGSKPVSEYPQTLINYIDDSINSSLSNIQLGSTQIYSDNFEATINLSALRVVNLQSGTYASNDNLSHVHAPLGLTITSITLGETTKALVFGEILDSSWNWSNNPIYLGTNGLLTQQLSGNEAFIQEVAKVKSDNRIIIEFKEVIIIN